MSFPRFVIEFGERQYEIRYQDAIALTEASRFDPADSNPFGIAPSRATPKRFDNFVGDTRQGGSCNVAEVTIVPHCHGTHTETVSHVCHELIPVVDCIGPQPLMALLVDVDGLPVESCIDQLPPQAAPGDEIITAEALQSAMGRLPFPPDTPVALVLRCHSSRRSEVDVENARLHAIYLSTNAMAWIRRNEFQHLLVNLPSIDRMDDGGALACHRIFWDLSEIGHDVADSPRQRCTITELLHIPDAAMEGFYLLIIQIPAWQIDAVPSRPFLLPLRHLRG